MKHNRIKLAVIGHRGFPGVQGGVEKHCEALIPLLANDMEISVYRRKPYLTADSCQTFAGVTYIDLPSTRIKGFEALFHTFIACLHAIGHRPDIANIHNIGPGLFAPLLRLFGIKVVLTYHSPNYEHDKWNNVSKLFLRLCERIALGSANHIIFVNKFQLLKYSDKIKNKSSYIPNGIPSVTRSTGSNFITGLGLRPGNYMLAVGRITPEKGFDSLIKAVNRCNTSINLVIAGACDHGSDYLQELKKLDTGHRVTFTGYTTGEDLRQLYSHAQCFVLSSLNEGFPLVLLEAMSYELPMIVSDIPATHLVNLHPSQYFKAGDVDALTIAIEQMLKSQQTNNSYDLTEFQWQQIAKETQSVYDALM